MCGVNIPGIVAYILAPIRGSLAPSRARANPEEFIHIFVDRSQQLTEFLEHMTKVKTSCL